MALDWHIIMYYVKRLLILNIQHLISILLLLLLKVEQVLSDGSWDSFGVKK